MVTSREVRLKSRPVGMPTADNLEIITSSVPGPGLGEVQVNNLWMTVDPYMRGRMTDRSKVVPSRDRVIGEIAASNETMFGWRPAFQLGEALDGASIGEVAASNDPSFKRGDLVLTWFGWREVFNAPAGALQKLDTLGLPPQAFLGVAGVNGLTAWVGLIIRSARCRTCWQRCISATSPAAFTLASTRIRSRTSAVGSTAKQRADASCCPDDRTSEVPMSHFPLSIDGELAKLVSPLPSDLIRIAHLIRIAQQVAP